MKRTTLIALAAVLVIAVIAGVLLIDRKDDEVVPGPGTAEEPAAGEVFRDCETCPQMKLLPAGDFTMGTPLSDATYQPPEGPAHAVSVDYPLAIGVHEVTVSEYQAFVADTAHEVTGCDAYDGAWQYRNDLNWDNTGFEQGASHPVTCVSWDDALAYVDWLSAKTGEPYRLPSAAEWEYAARAGADQSRPWGENLDAACASANVADRTAAERFPGWTVHSCSDGNVFTASVGSFEPNAFGLYDTLGNVFEWVLDCWQDDYADAPGDGSARLDGVCSFHELRGGSWYSMPQYVRVAFRNRFEANYRGNSFGFRVAKEVSR